MKRLLPALWTAAMLGGVACAADEHEAVRRIHDRITAREAAVRPAAKAAPYSVTIPNTTVSYDMVPIPAGEFMMGSTAKKDEQQAHPVRLDAFWMQAHEVTWDEYRLFMFENQAGEKDHKDAVVDAVSRPTRPYVEMSFGMGINGYPAISMTQHAAAKYAEWLSAKTGEFYRLPTEAEWEYACRAGSDGPYAATLADYAWFAADSNGKYQKVAGKKPNQWGLYDMLGNVMEWTLDGYAPYKAGLQLNPWVRPSGPYPHAVRGGSWSDGREMLRCSARVASDASWKQQDPQLPKSVWYMTDAQWLGFRLVRSAKVPSAEEMYSYWNSGVEHDEALLLPANRDRRLYEAAEPHMGTLVGIKLYASSESEAKKAFRAAFDRIAQLDAILSDYNPESELNRIGLTAVHRFIRVSDDLFHVLASSQELATRSGGAFDVTLGPVIRLWREARRQQTLPDPDALSEALARCGYRKLHLDKGALSVMLDQEGMQLDVGGIAKGYAADEALEILKRLGIRSAIVAVSGDLAIGDAPPGDRGWSVALPSTDGIANLCNAAVSTSGDSEQHLDANGLRYSHIIDPASGGALTHGLTVTVIAPHGILADGLSTAASVLGEAGGERLVSQYPGAVIRFQLPHRAHTDLEHILNNDQRER